MPLHDWTHVRHGMFHHFHNAWIYRLADLLNGGVLPAGFYAAGEQVAGDVEPDVVALEATPAMDPWDHTGAIAVAEHPPAVATQQTAEASAWIRKQDQLAIRRVGSDRLVAVVEIVPPANKSSRVRLSKFVEKVTAFVTQGVHAIVVDVFPPGRLDPNGIHATIWEELTSEPATTMANTTGCITSYEVGTTVRAYVEPLQWGLQLSSPPLFLEEGWYVPAPLEDAYIAAWQFYPQPWKLLIESSHPSS